MKKYRYSNLYNAFDRYKERLSKEPDHSREAALVSSAVLSGGVTERSKNTVKIATDWIEAIEEAIPQFHQAIAQNRQFIQRSGNVVPVEKARKVTRESAEHLARHTELLREDGPYGIVPSKLYVKENQSNYAVYENRFLYTALCHCRDFTDAKYKAILRADHTDKTALAVNARFALENRKYACQLAFSEEAAEDTGPDASSEHRSLIKRIENIRFDLSRLLGTPLMLEMAKEPPVQAPITVTNILKSDANFQAVFLLYHYLSSYEGDGYVQQEEKTPRSPISQGLSQDLAELILLNALVLHCHTSQRTEGYREAALASRLSEEAQLAEAAVLAAAEIREAAGCEGEKQYIALLEKALYRLQQTRDLAQEVQAHQQILSEQLLSLTDQAEMLKRQLAQSQEDCRRALLEAQQRLDQERTAWNQKAQEAAKDLLAQRSDLAAQLKTAKASLAEQEKQLSHMQEENHLLGARLLSARQRLGEQDSTNYTEKANFDLLEAEKNAFDKFFAEIWKATKKQIVLDCVKGKK